MCATAVTKQAKICSSSSSYSDGNLRDGVGISSCELARHDTTKSRISANFSASTWTYNTPRLTARTATLQSHQKIYIYHTIFSCVMNKLTSRCFKFPPKCFEKSSATDAGRTILPSPENSPTIPDLFSKVWGAEPTRRQHYRPQRQKKPKKVTRLLGVLRTGEEDEALWSRFPPHMLAFTAAARRATSSHEGEKKKTHARRDRRRKFPRNNSLEWKGVNGGTAARVSGDALQNKTAVRPLYIHPVRFIGQWGRRQKWTIISFAIIDSNKNLQLTMLEAKLLHLNHLYSTSSTQKKHMEYKMNHNE